MQVKTTRKTVTRGAEPSARVLEHARRERAALIERRLKQAATALLGGLLFGGAFVYQVSQLLMGERVVAVGRNLQEGSSTGTTILLCLWLPVAFILGAGSLLVAFETITGRMDDSLDA